MDNFQEQLFAKYFIELVKYSQLVFWIRNVDYTQQLYVSPAYEKVWGRTCESLYKAPEEWINFLLPEDKDRLEQDIAKRHYPVLPGQKFSQCYRIIRPDNSIRWLMDESFAVFNKQNELVGFCGIARDITDEKEREHFLEQAKEAAEAASKSKTDFIANMSHDIRTPLTGIIGMARMLEEQVQDKEHQQYAQLLKDSGNNLLELLNSVLDVVSADKADEKKLNLKTFDLRKRIKRVGKLQLPTIKVKGLELKLEIDEKLPQCVVSDEMKLNRILLNLLGNAIKFTKEGHVGISAKVVKQDEQEAFIEFKVFDSGIGIDEESQTKVFDRFFRISPSYAGIYRGHGVGLHIVQQFVKRLGGEVSLTSEVGKGTTFSFTLQLKIGRVEDVVPDEYDEQEEVRQPTALVNQRIKSTASETSPLSKASLNVLLVEDNGVALMLIENIIKAAGHRFTSASDGQQALVLVKNNDFDLMFTDIGLPNLSGIELTEQIRTWEKEQHKKHMPIVALTGHAGGAAEQECLQAGIDKVLTKPTNLNAVQSLIKHFNLDSKARVSAETASASETKELSDLESEWPVDESTLFDLSQYRVLDIANGIITLGSEKILKEMLNLMLDPSLPQDEAAIKAAYAKQDWQQVEDLAHRIKSGAIYCGTTRLRYACQYLENYQKADRHELQERLYQQLLTVIAETKAAILKWLNGNYS